MPLRLHAYRFDFEALEPLDFPPGTAANAFRGAFGQLFRGVCCRPDCPGAKICPWRDQCPYARLFEPVWTEGPSGLLDPPRPFVIRAASLEGRSFVPGGQLLLDFHLFDVREPLLNHLVATFQQLAATGIGPRRGRVALRSVHSLTASRGLGACVYRKEDGFSGEISSHIELPLSAEGHAPVHSATLRFLTPTELKMGGRVLEDAPFEAVFARARDRVATISSLYSGASPDLDFRALGAAASAIWTVRSDLRWMAARRRSSRTGQVHPLGGFVGEAAYAGDLAPFLPILRAAYWTGIGRQTVWGKGVIDVCDAV